MGEGVGRRSMVEGEGYVQRQAGRVLSQEWSSTCMAQHRPQSIGHLCYTDEWVTGIDGCCTGVTKKQAARTLLLSTHSLASVALLG